MKKILLSSLIVTTSLLAQGYIQSANQVSKDLLQTLGGNLKKELKTNGALKALQFCSTNAQGLTHKINEKYEKEWISVKRISLKNRSDADKPSDDEKIILQSLENMIKVGVKPHPVVQDKGDYVKVYKPLMINKKVCLKCHGDVNKHPKLAKELKMRYPHDKATGYKMGDFRGAIVVSIKKKDKK
jgi:hypothetical protein